MHLGDHVSVNGDGNVVFRILGTEGDIEFYGWQSAYQIRNADHPTGERIDVSTDLRISHQRHLENLAIQMDRDEPDYHLIENSWTALELCEVAYLSARHGCAISLPLLGLCDSRQKRLGSRYALQRFRGGTKWTHIVTKDKVAKNE